MTTDHLNKRHGLDALPPPFQEAIAHLPAVEASAVARMAKAVAQQGQRSSNTFQRYALVALRFLRYLGELGSQRNAVLHLESPTIAEMYAYLNMLRFPPETWLHPNRFNASRLPGLVHPMSARAARDELTIFGSLFNTLLVNHDMSGNPWSGLDCHMWGGPPLCNEQALLKSEWVR